jgi:uncharacterized membrane protein
MKKNRKRFLIKLQNLVIYFFVCSFIGWILEVAYAFSVFGTFVDRGFLHGPICPIYGCGAVAMVLITNWIKRKKIKNIWIMFAIVTAIATILEYIASFILEKIFGLRWWDYTGYFLNINGRVCLIFAIFFGIAGIIFIKKLYVPIEKGIRKLRKKMSSRLIGILLILCLITLGIDVYFSYIKYTIPENSKIDSRVVIYLNK